MYSYIEIGRVKVTNYYGRRKLGVLKNRMISPHPNMIWPKSGHETSSGWSAVRKLHRNMQQAAHFAKR